MGYPHIMTYYLALQFTFLRARSLFLYGLVYFFNFCLLFYNPALFSSN